MKILKKRLPKKWEMSCGILANLATELNLSLEEIASLNIKKLSSRKERGRLRGSGNER